jgi:hypothetical protein
MNIMFDPCEKCGQVFGRASSAVAETRPHVCVPPTQLSRTNLPLSALTEARVREIIKEELLKVQRVA